VWKYLQHRNIVPLLGVISTPVQSLQLISEWMPGGVLTDYIKSHPIADRFSLVGVPRSFDLELTSIAAIRCRSRPSLSTLPQRSSR